MVVELQKVPDRARETWLSWSAVVTAALSVFAWAACCVLPMTLSVAGLSLAGTGLIAGQRTWMTALTVLLLAGGWLFVIRKARRCRVDTRCASPSRLTVWLLGIASVLTVIALIWEPIVEPFWLAQLRTLHQ
jgi:mercuric ion transport protein